MKYYKTKVTGLCLRASTADALKTAIKLTSYDHITTSLGIIRNFMIQSNIAVKFYYAPLPPRGRIAHCNPSVVCLFVRPILGQTQAYKELRGWREFCSRHV